MLWASPILMVPGLVEPGRVWQDLTAPANSSQLRRAQEMMVQEKFSSPESDARLSQADISRQTCILLAEDDRALKRFLEVVLERAGYQVITASDGLEAMKVVLSKPVDVVVTDEMMPNLSGHELCRFLRNSPALSHLPVIMLSALERKDINHGEQADAFLSKPVSGETLIACIEELLANRKKVMSDE